MARIVGEVRPRFVFVENSPNLVSRGLAVVLGDLAALGYDDIRWCVLGADDAGAPHRRKRIWIVAESSGDGCLADHGRGAVPDGIGDGAGAARKCVEQPGTCGAGDVADASVPRRGEGQPGQSWQIRDEARGQESQRRGGDVPDADGSLRDRRANEQGRGQEGRNAAVGDGEDVPDAMRERGCGRHAEGKDAEDAVELRGSARDDASGMGWWQSEPVLDLLANGLAAGVHGADATIEGGVGRVAVGVPARVQRLKCIGNGQVPLCAAMAWQILTASDGGDKEAWE